MKLVFQVSQIFQEKEFYIVNGPSSHPKAVLEKKVAEVFFLSLYYHETVSF